MKELPNLEINKSGIHYSLLLNINTLCTINTYLRRSVGRESWPESGAHLCGVLLEETVSSELGLGHRSEAAHDLFEDAQSDKTHAVAARAGRDERHAHELCQVQHEQVARRLRGLPLARKHQVEVRRVLLLSRARTRVDQPAQSVHREKANCACRYGYNTYEYCIRMQSCRYGIDTSFPRNWSPTCSSNFIKWKISNYSNQAPSVEQRGLRGVRPRGPQR